jgi:hypothetical protein
VLHSNASIEYRNGSAALVPIIVGVDGRVDDFNKPRAPLAAERAIDSVLADSFPASDPPSWNPGVARPDPASGASNHVTSGDTRTASPLGGGTSAAGVIDVSTPRMRRTPVQGFVSGASAASLALLLPFAILIIGLPVVLAVRALLEAIGWLFGVDLR